MSEAVVARLADHTQQCLALFVPAPPSDVLFLSWKRTLRGVASSMTSPYLCETSNSLLENLTKSGQSFAIQDAHMAYFLNVLKPINDACRMHGEDEADITDRRAHGEHIRLLATDTADKQRFQVQMVVQLAQRYTPLLLSRIPTREEIAKKGTREFNKEQIQKVLEVATQKRGQHFVSMKSILEGMSLLNESATDESSNDAGESAEDTALGLLVTQQFWNKVPKGEILQEARWLLPHAYTWLRSVKIPIISKTSKWLSSHKHKKHTKEPEE